MAIPGDAETSLRGFDRSLPMSLMRAREAVMKEFVPHLRTHDLTPQQWRVIRALEQRGSSDMSELSERCFLLKPSLSRIVQTLEGRGLIERSNDAADQRRSGMKITAAGESLFKKIAPESAERYDRITRLFGFGKLELLYELLDELVVALETGEEI